MATFTVTVNLEPFLRVAQRLRDDVCVLMPKCVGWWDPPRLLHQRKCLPHYETEHILFLSLMQMSPIKIKRDHPTDDG